MSTYIRKKTAIIAFLAQMSAGEWVTRKALNLNGNITQGTSRVLHQMQDEGLIKCKGGYIDKQYHITETGHEYLAKVNPERYGRKEMGEEKIQIRSEKKLIDREVLRSTVAIMSQLAGYGVHPHDKPNLSVASLYEPVMADRPAFIAQAAAGIEIPNDKAILNYTDYQYYGKTERSDAQKDCDVGEYRTRSTPIGCYYSRTEILSLARYEAESRENGKSNIQNINTSRVAGILFSGHGAYKVYATKNTAMKIHEGADEAITNSILAWAENVYKRTLEKISENSRDQQLRGNILIGDGDYMAAIKVLDKTGYYGKKDEPKQIFGSETVSQRQKGSNYNLIRFPRSYYFPAIREALCVYSAMIYPKFDEALRGALDFYAELTTAAVFNNPDYPAYFDAKTADGRNIACIIPLSLDRILHIMETINGDTKGIVIYCPEYETAFYDKFLITLDDDVAKLFEIIPIPQDFLEGYFIGVLQESYGYSGPFPIKPENRWAITAKTMGLEYETE